jgi:hypothetical protein
MTAQPARIDLADLGPGVAWAFEFDENGAGASVLLPPAFVTGYFGMNTKGLPFGGSDYGTAYATIFCLLAAGVVCLLIRRYRAVS